MKQFFLLSVFACLGFMSCKEKKHTPKVIYESPNMVKSENNLNDTVYQIADLPIAFDGLDFLIHPIGQIRISTNSKYASRDENLSYTLTNHLDYEIQGLMENLLFQVKNADSLYKLSEKPLLISRVNFLNTYFNNSKKQFFVYEVYDEDSNKDKMIDRNDIKSLFISEKLGSNFKKISVDMQELIDWQYYDGLNRIYFRTVEDINKNGRFDSSDKTHYYYLSLNDNTFEPLEYNPIK